MPFAQGRHLAVDSRTVGVKVVRFDGPDLRDQLQDDGATDGCALYREIQSSALANLKPGELLVVNLGPIEVFTPAFLSLLLNVRHVVRQRLARLVLCELREQQRELLQVTKTLPLFTIADNEGEALQKAKHERPEWELVPIACRVG
jgi:anti-anti-sigma regulatory factor